MKTRIEGYLMFFKMEISTLPSASNDAHNILNYEVSNKSAYNSGSQRTDT
jgi:hypothetical protein